MRSLVLLGLFAAGVACGFGGAFACADDEDCEAGGELGVCQAIGQCSFPDDECPSGQRYGEHVGGGFAGECVPPADDSTGSVGDTTDDDTSGVGDDLPADDDAASLDVTSDSADPETSSSGPVGVDDTAGSTEEGGESTGGPLEIDPDLVLWLTFDDPMAPFVDASTYARDVGCDIDTEACPGVDADGDLAGTFDGVNDMLQVPHDPALETDAGLTVAVRVRNDALSSLLIHSVIARPYGIVTENSWELFFRDETADGVNDVVFEIADLGGQLQLIADAPVAKGEWTAIAAVWSVGAVDLYFDGVLQTSAVSTGMLFDDSPIVVGGDIDDLLPTNYFTGAIDDVRVYRRALSQAEIAALP